jgi:hypothetical protein
MEKGRDMKGKKERSEDYFEHLHLENLQKDIHARRNQITCSLSFTPTLALFF